MDREVSAMELLRRPGVSYRSLQTLADREGGQPLQPQEGHRPSVSEQIEIQAKYAGYITRQRGEVERSIKQEKTKIPLELDYSHVRGLSTEVRQKLQVARPESLGQAGRISGVTPAAISLLWVHLKRLRMAVDGPESSEKVA